MSKEKGPPGYPGDEAIRKKFGELMRELRLEKGLSLEEVEAFIDERTQEDAHLLLARAFSLVTRELRERKKMSRAELSEVSGLPLRFINRLERGRARNMTLPQLVMGAPMSREASERSTSRAALNTRMQPATSS